VQAWLSEVGMFLDVGVNSECLGTRFSGSQ